MREYAVKDYVDPLLLCGFAETYEYDICTETCDIVKLFFDALEITAEIIVVGNISAGIGAPVRHIVPVCVYFAVVRDILMRNSAFCKSVRENLIHNTALEPVRSCHSLLINGKLEKIAVIYNALACAVFLDIMTVVIDKQREVIVMKPVVIRNINA